MRASSRQEEFDLCKVPTRGEVGKSKWEVTAEFCRSQPSKRSSGASSWPSKPRSLDSVEEDHQITTPVMMKDEQ